MDSRYEKLAVQSFAAKHKRKFVSVCLCVFLMVVQVFTWEMVPSVRILRNEIFLFASYVVGMKEECNKKNGIKSISYDT